MNPRILVDSGDVCGHVWLSRDRDPNNPPIACARCKSPYWNRNARKQYEARSKDSDV